MTHPDPKPGRSRGTMRLRRSAAAGRPEVWEVTYAGRQHVVEGDEAAAVAKLHELAHDAKPKRPA